MKKFYLIIVLIIQFLFYSCNSTKKCIVLDQGYLSYSDHGYVNFYVCNEKCRFFEEYDKNEDIKLSEKHITFYRKVQSYFQSSKIINEKYYNDFCKILEKYSIRGTNKDGIILIKYLNNNEIVTKKATILFKNYYNFKKEINDLNLKYNISEEEKHKIYWYFDILEKGYEPKE